MKHLAAVFAVACALCALPALAQQAPTSPTPAPSESPSPAPTHAWQASGFAAASYTTTNSSASTTNAFNFNNGTSSRVFDTINGQPMLSALNLQLVRNGTLGGKAEITLGTNADVIASYPYNNPPFHYPNGLDVTQLYAQYASGKLTAIAGKFETLAGAEVIEDPSNSNISRSILFGFAVPFTHTGARLSYAPSSLWTVIAGINNGWDNLKGSSDGRTGEFGLQYNDGSVFSGSAAVYAGKERISNAAWSTPAGSPTGARTLVDLVGTVKANPKLSLVGNFDHGIQQNAPIVNAAGVTTNPAGTASWTGEAGYLNYQFDSRWSTSLRGEIFTDGGGYRTGFDQRWREASLTFAYAPSTPLVFRLEVRSDVSNQPVFLNGQGVASNTLGTLGLQALVKF